MSVGRLFVVARLALVVIAVCSYTVHARSVDTTRLLCDEYCETDESTLAVYYCSKLTTPANTVFHQCYGWVRTAQALGDIQPTRALHLLQRGLSGGCREHDTVQFIGYKLKATILAVFKRKFVEAERLQRRAIDKFLAMNDMGMVDPTAATERAALEGDLASYLALQNAVHDATQQALISLRRVPTPQGYKGLVLAQLRNGSYTEALGTLNVARGFVQDRDPWFQQHVLLALWDNALSDERTAKGVAMDDATAVRCAERLRGVISSSAATPYLRANLALLEFRALNPTAARDVGWEVLVNVDPRTLDSALVGTVSLATGISALLVGDVATFWMCINVAPHRYQLCLLLTFAVSGYLVYLMCRLSSIELTVSSLAIVVVYSYFMQLSQLAYFMVLYSKVCAWVAPLPNMLTFGAYPLFVF